MAAKNPSARQSRLPAARIRPLVGAAAVPLMLLAFGALTVWQWPGVRQFCQPYAPFRALLAMLPFLPHGIFGALLLAGGRYNNAGLIFSALALSLAYLASAGGALLPAAGPAGVTRTAVLQTLLPLNLAFHAMLTRSRLFSPRWWTASALTLLQAVGLAAVFIPSVRGHDYTLTVLQHPMAAALLARWDHVFDVVRGWCVQLDLLGWPLAQLSLLISLGFLGLRLMRTADGLIAGFGAALVAAWQGAACGQPAAALWFSAAGLILGATLLDSTYRMAYHDELTGLPGRRSLNETLMNLGRQYVVAMIDVDHFKSFNDRFGHDTGDDVLRLIAAKLARLSGGAKTFRYGGEEFAAVFPGKTAEEAHGHLEAYRRALADTPFRVRRKKGGPGAAKPVRVTVSIGVSASDRRTKDPAVVLKAADQALYRAKKAGRNRVVT